MSVWNVMTKLIRFAVSVENRPRGARALDDLVLPSK
jgi:hypothetical protein